jgi:hypothetical protein
MGRKPAKQWPGEAVNGELKARSFGSYEGKSSPLKRVTSSRCSGNSYQRDFKIPAAPSVRAPHDTTKHPKAR